MQPADESNAVRTEDPPSQNKDTLSHGTAFSFSGEDCEAVGGSELGCSGNVTAEEGEVRACVRACLCRCVEDRRQRNCRLVMQSCVPNRKLRHRHVEFGVTVRGGVVW